MKKSKVQIVKHGCQVPGFGGVVSKYPQHDLRDFGYTLIVYCEETKLYYHYITTKWK